MVSFKINWIGQYLIPLEISTLLNRINAKTYEKIRDGKFIKMHQWNKKTWIDLPNFIHLKTMKIHNLKYIKSCQSYVWTKLLMMANKAYD